MNYKTILCTLLAVHIANGMFMPLSTIEKQIFFKHVNQIGKEAALRKIKKTQDPYYRTTKYAYRKDWCRLVIPPCFTITTKVDPQAEDSFSQLVVNIITEKEKEN